MKIGYARVSTNEQSLDRQIIKLQEAGVESRYIFTDKLSGKNFDRPEYLVMRRMLRKGDILFIDSIDRLGRDFDGVINEWKHITQSIGADVVALDNDEIFDSRKFRSMGDVGKLLESQLLSILSYVADQERKKLLERQRAGIDAAKAAGVKFGRTKIEPTEDFYKSLKLWEAGSITAVEAMKLAGMKKTTWYANVKTFTSNKKS